MYAWMLTQEKEKEVREREGEIERGREGETDRQTDKQSNARL